MSSMNQDCFFLIVLLNIAFSNEAREVYGRSSGSEHMLVFRLSFFKKFSVLIRKQMAPHWFQVVVEWLNLIIGLIGVSIISFGILYSSLRFGYHRYILVDCSAAGTFGSFRKDLARGILIGLEFLVAADIIASVAVIPTTLAIVGQLAIIIVIRTLLSFSLEIETEGRLPWKKEDEDSQRGPSAAEP